MSNLIDRQAAIDALAEHEKSRGHNYTLFVDIVSECAEIIRNLPAVQPETHEEHTETRACDLERWIPCSERPPEEDGEYLVTVKYGYDGGYEEVFVDSMDWHKGHWSNFFFSHPGMVESIPAWMPFPEPYKEEQE